MSLVRKTHRDTTQDTERKPEWEEDANGEGKHLLAPGGGGVLFSLLQSGEHFFFLVAGTSSPCYSSGFASTEYRGKVKNSRIISDPILDCEASGDRSIYSKMIL